MSVGRVRSGAGESPGQPVVIDLIGLKGPGVRGEKREADHEGKGKDRHQPPDPSSDRSRL
jgi:hypothetical protein